jgi:hypothetical protein
VRRAGQPARLVLTSGAVYTPIGANLAWADKDRVAFHLRALDAFGRAGLNWTRIWMVHWSGLNLDWLPEDMGRSPPSGYLDLRVAADWDKIVAMAEEKGVYLQIVFQHHGQYSSVADSSWGQNPWNAANPGGFLPSAAEFFTSLVAKELTALKYRYIVARWGYSPAVLAWQLFNEVHWTDAIERNHDEAAVGKRDRNFIALWLWHRTGVLALTPPPAASGTLLLEDVPAGTWRVIWWDSLRGVPAVPVTIWRPASPAHAAHQPPRRGRPDPLIHPPPPPRRPSDRSPARRGKGAASCFRPVGLLLDLTNF